MKKLLGIFGLLVVVFAATLGQNRFGYYLVPVAAIATGCVVAWIADAVGRRAGRTWARAVALLQRA